AVPDYRNPRPLRGIPGVAIGVRGRPTGCAFAVRCRQRVDRCSSELPALVGIGPRNHLVRCFMAAETPEPAGNAGSRTVRDDGGPPLLAVEGLRATYPSRSSTVVAADDVTFDVADGEAVAIVGESGSGKSTIARCLMGLHAPEAGTIVFDQ